MMMLSSVFTSALLYFISIIRIYCADTATESSRLEYALYDEKDDHMFMDKDFTQQMSKYDEERFSSYGLKSAELLYHEVAAPKSHYCNNLFQVYNITDADEEIQICGLTAKDQKKAAKGEALEREKGKTSRVHSVEKRMIQGVEVELTDKPWAVLIKVETVMKIQMKMKDDGGERTVEMTDISFSTGSIFHRHYILASRHSLPLGIKERLKLKAAQESYIDNLGLVTATIASVNITILPGKIEMKSLVRHRKEEQEFNVEPENVMYEEKREFSSEKMIKYVNMNYGLALIRVPKNHRIVFGKEAQPVCIPAVPPHISHAEAATGHTLVSESCTSLDHTYSAVGYGSASDAGDSHSTLHSLTFTPKATNRVGWKQIQLFQDSTTSGKGASEADHGSVLTAKRLMPSQQTQEVEREFAMYMITMAKADAKEPYDRGVIGRSVADAAPWIAECIYSFEQGNGGDGLGSGDGAAESPEVITRNPAPVALTEDPTDQLQQSLVEVIKELQETVGSGDHYDNQF